MKSSSSHSESISSEQNLLLQQPWSRGVLRLLRRRTLLWVISAVLVFLVLLGCILTSSQTSLRSWFAMTGALSGLGIFALFLAWLYEHARSEEILEQWIVDLPRTLGRAPPSSEILGWIDDLDLFAGPPSLQLIRGSTLKQIEERLLSFAEQQAIAEVIANPLEWTAHAELAEGLSRLYQLNQDEEIKLRALEELGILQTLAPQDPECWMVIIRCSVDLGEEDVELHAREKFAHLKPERGPTIALGRALFRCGLAGRGFALYRQLLNEDPEGAQLLLQAYQPQLGSAR